MSKGRHWILVLGGGIAAVVISTTAIAPIAYPIAKLLDCVLGGKEHTTYKKAELRSFLQFHRTGEEPLRDDEIAILNGVLELNTKNAESIMTPMEDTVTLSSDCILDHAKVDSIILSGYSRFPVHTPDDPTAFIGLLLVKKLLTYDPSKALPVSSFELSILPEAHPTINCFQALDYFQTGRAHLLLISRTPGRAGGAIGVITLEEIVDETDRYEDNHHKRTAKRMTTATIMRGIVERQRRAESVARSIRRTDSIRGWDRDCDENSPLLAPAPRTYDSVYIPTLLSQSLTTNDQSTTNDS
ncbi:hypothetical protein H0H87_001342 [Tephrocybe sp. NHM501043]|nr:hypothetical protein H0H87_001342 [Tephrocybe sp. NHM501043]